MHIIVTDDNKVVQLRRKPPTCPLRGLPCTEEGCAWYYYSIFSEHGECALAILAQYATAMAMGEDEQE